MQPVQRDLRRTIAQILRVNHAGEYGAIRIYEAQLVAARRLFPDLTPFLEETLSHEREHCSSFRTLMRPRGTRPCGAMPVWGIGGFALGLITALLGRRAIMICTAAVERTVHRHLNAQIRFLSEGNKDHELTAVIERIRNQELGHLEFAERHAAQPGRFERALDGIVSGATALLIWLSTYGSHTRMRRALERRETS